MVPVRRNTQSWLPDIFNDFFDSNWMEKATTAPAINVIENESEYDVEVAAPGMTKDDFKVRLDQEGNLVIEMEKKEENHEKKHGRYLRREFAYNKFQQTFLMPEDADAEKISAKVEHGVLGIHIPKVKPVEKPEVHRTIEIQ